MVSKVLFVDDSQALHQIYKVTLKRYKCETLTALSREEGLKKLSENPGIDLIFVDMNMSLSRISGIEFIRKVKAQSEYADIPIVVVTTRGKNYAQEIFDLAQGNLVKPFTSGEIHKLIETFSSRTVSA